MRLKKSANIIKKTPDKDNFGTFQVSEPINIFNKKTDIGESGYSIKNAVTEIYEDRIIR